MAVVQEGGVFSYLCRWLQISLHQFTNEPVTICAYSDFGSARQYRFASPAAKMSSTLVRRVTWLSDVIVGCETSRFSNKMWRICLRKKAVEFSIRQSLLWWLLETSNTYKWKIFFVIKCIALSAPWLLTKFGQPIALNGRRLNVSTIFIKTCDVSNDGIGNVEGIWSNGNILS
jgi:hypothetical protein